MCSEVEEIANKNLKWHVLNNNERKTKQEFESRSDGEGREGNGNNLQERQRTVQKIDKFL